MRPSRARASGLRAGSGLAKPSKKGFQENRVKGVRAAFAALGQLILEVMFVAPVEK